MMSAGASPVAESAPRALGGWLALIAGIAARAFLVFGATLAAFAVLPLLFGISGSIVQSGSMVPSIAIGDVVLAQPLARSAPVQIGRVMTFHATSPTGERVLMLHRVIGVHPDGTFVTAGDANRDADSTPLERSDMVGTAFLRIPLVGLPAFWFAHGDAAMSALWILLTAGAIAVEVLARRAEGSTEEAPRHARRRTISLGAIARTASGVVLPAALIAAIVAAPLGPANAAFTARTSSLGSSWSAAVLAPATKLAFTTMPSASTGGVAFPAQPVVEVRNAAGTRVTGSRTVQLAITSAAGATLTCAATRVTGDTGVLAFTGCSIDKAGTYTLTAAATSLTSAVSTSFVVATGPAAALVYTAAPSTTQAGSAFTTQPAVAIVDAGGNRTASTKAVALAITGTTTAALSCSTNPRTALAGLATFSACAISKAGTYTLTATSSGLASAVSTAFVITAPPQLTCSSSIWMATFSWSPTPYAPTVYHLYVNGIQVAATGADGWNSYVQLTSGNVPASTFAPGTASVEVRQVTASGGELEIGVGTVVLGTAAYRTYQCG